MSEQPSIGFGRDAEMLTRERLQAIRVALILISGIAFFLSGTLNATALANPSLREALSEARTGDPRAQYIAGMMYLLGDGTAQDISEAAHWLQQSARARLPQAMVALAGLYDVGAGVSFDPDRSTSLREEAARAGELTARSQLDVDARFPGMRDYRRASILTDLKLYREAARYARASATAGCPEGQELLGRDYHFGQGLPVDKAQALKLYEEAAEGGSVDALRDIAYIYEFGEGVEVDRKKALVYYDRAAAMGSKIAKQAADNLRSPDYDAPLQGQSGSILPGGPSSPSNSNAQACQSRGGVMHYDNCDVYHHEGSVRIDPQTGAEVIQ